MKRPYKIRASVIITNVFDMAILQYTFPLMNFNLDSFCIILLAECEYGNKTFGINHTYITLDCKEKCVCEVINGTALANCSSLCNIPVDPLCTGNTQQVVKFQQNLKGTNCSCPVKRCIKGLNLFVNNYLQMFTQIVCVSEV